MILACRSIVLLVLASAVHSVSKARVCESPECLALSALITSNMNLTADPCEDFVSYACGNFPLNTQYDPAIVSWSEYDGPMLMQSGIDIVSDRLRKKVFELLLVNSSVDSDDFELSSMYRLTRSMFRSCTNWIVSRTTCGRSDCDWQTSEDFFNGALSHLMDTISERKMGGSFERALAKMSGMLFWPLIGISPSRQMFVDRTATNVSRVEIKQSIQDYRLDTNVQPFMEFFSGLSATSKLSLDRLNTAQFNKTLKEAYDLVETNKPGNIADALSRCAMVQSLGTDLSKYEYSIKELNALSKISNPNNSFSWSLFLAEILEVDDVDENTLIYFHYKLKGAIKVIDLLTYFKERAFWQKDGKLSPHFSFLVIDWLFSFAPYFPQRLANNWERNNYRRTYMPTLKYNPVTNCIDLTKQLLGPVVEMMYQKSHHVESFDKVSELVELIQNNTMSSVREQRWLTQKSKEAIVEKIMAQKHSIGFNEIPVQEFKAIYGPTIRSFNSGSYSQRSKDFGMLFSLTACAYAGLVKTMFSSNSTSSVVSSMGGLVVNAFNDMRENKIIFPMGILSPFFYHSSYPAYMNLGGIGVIIGHEIGHGFDDYGHELNKNGVYGHFWDNDTETEYLKRMRCVESKFSEYELIPGRPHKSESTLGNDISDLMGIRSAFSALKSLGERGRLLRLPNLPSSLSPEHLFFVQAAQAWCTKAEPETLLKVYGDWPSHSPPHIRIRGMMEHSRDFARVFQCKANQTMNPSEKCEFW